MEAIKGLLVSTNSPFPKHTWFPYFTFQLSSLILVDKITFHFVDGSTLRRFIVYISPDNERFFPIYAKTDETEPSQFWTVNLSPKLRRLTRFVKVQSSDHATFFVSDLHVTGECPPIRISDLTNSPKTEQKIAFSCLFNETPQYLKSYVKNFILNTDSSCVLFVNLGKSYNYNHVVSEFCHLSNIIFFIGETVRKAWGSTLLLGHIESFEEAKRYDAQFSYFCTVSSNTLFVKPFKIEPVVDTFSLDTIVPLCTERFYDQNVRIDLDNSSILHNKTWPWHELIENNFIPNMLKERIGNKLFHIGQIEGLLTSFECWGKVASVKDILVEISIDLPSNTLLPLEELIPATIAYEFFPNQTTNICYMLWDGLKRADERFLGELVPFLPQHLFMIKWFNRIPGDPGVTLSTSTVSPFLFRFINEIVNNTLSFYEVDLALNSLLMAPIQEMRLRFEHCFSSTSKFQNKCVFLSQPLEKLQCDDGLLFHHEHLHQHLIINTSVAREADKVVLHMLSFTPQSRDTGTLAAYVYVKIESFQDSNTLMLCLCEASSLDLRLTYFSSGDFGLITQSYRFDNFGKNIYIPIDQFHDRSDFYIGIPAHYGEKLSVAIIKLGAFKEPFFDAV